MDLTRVRLGELARQPLRGQDFANAFTAAFGCTAEEFERDPAIRRRVREASPLSLVSADDPPGFLMAAAGEVMNANRHLAVPDVINDPHSAWHSVLLADALEKVGVKSACRIGPQVGQDVQADHAAILDFLRRTWNRRSEGQAPAAGAGKVPKSVTAPGKSHQTGGTPARITLEAQAGAMNVLARVPILDNQVFALGIPETIFRNG